MKVAITGASGFLGRYLVRHLIAEGHDCRGLTRSPDRRAASPPSVEWVVGALGDEAAVRALVDGADAVIHAAFDHPGGGFQAAGIDVVALVENNLVATIRLIEATRAARVGRFVVISSGAVQDEILLDRPLDEMHPLWPKTHYGATKAAIEAFVHSYGRGEQFPICALRPTAIYGPAEPITASRWYALVASVVRGDDVDCRRGSKQVHAYDVARAAGLLLTAEEIAGEIYHCTDLFVPDRRVAELARSVAGSAAKITGDAPPSRHPIDCAKLKKLGMNFGGEPLLEVTIEEMVWSITTGKGAEVPTDRR